MERAKIRVEHIVREDYLVEAMEVRISAHILLPKSSKGVIEIMPPPIEQIQLNKLMNYVWLTIDGLSP